MAILNDTVVQLVNEGIFNMTNPLYFDKDTLQKISDNIYRPVGMVPGPDYIPPVPLPETPPPILTIPTPSFIFCAKSQKHLLIACDLIQLYETIGRNMTAANIQWFLMKKNFGEQYKSLTNCRK